MRLEVAVLTDLAASVPLHRNSKGLFQVELAEIFTHPLTYGQSTCEVVSAVEHDVLTLGLAVEE